MITDEIILTKIKLISEMYPAAYFAGNTELVILSVLKVANIILRHGNDRSGAVTFSSYGTIMGAVLGDLKNGYEFGKLALAIAERYPDLSSKCRAYMIYATLIHHWNHHRNEIEGYLHKAIEYGFESGAVLFRGHSACHVWCWGTNTHLEIVVSEGTKYLQMIQQTGFQDCWDVTIAHYQMFVNLLGRTDSRDSLSDSFFNEQECLEKMQKANLELGLSNYYYCKSQILYYYDDFQQALKYLKELDKKIEGCIGQPYVPDACLLAFLIHSALYPKVVGKWRGWRRMKKEYKQMKKWADHCPVNFYHNQLLMEAELARLSGDFNSAMQLYEKAILTAKNNDYLSTEALANELTAKFYLQQGLRRVAKDYMLDAHYCYNKWGAKAKLDHIESTYPDFFAEETAPEYKPKSTKVTSIETTQGVDSESLDIGTVMKASEVISGEINLRSLIKKMMDIVIENAGAEKGYLILRKGDDYFIEAEASINSEEIEILQHSSITNLPNSIINYVISTKEPVVLSDAIREGAYTKDPYISSVQPKSVLCFPLLHQGVMKGILYFENNLTTGAFTQLRVELLNLISSQIATSIENAQFYGELEDKVEERTNDLKRAQNQLIFQEKIASLGSLTAGIAHELKNPLNFVINFAQVAKSDLVDLLREFDSLSKEELKEVIKEVQNYLETINTQGTRADGIIKRMLAHSREGSKILEKTDINSLIEQAINLTFHSYLKKDPTLKLRVEKNYDENLPIIEAYPSELTYLFINMVDNACYALSEKIKKYPKDFIPTLEVSTSFDKKNITIIFKDNGPGMTKEEVEKIFTPFYTTKPAGVGTGLGLSLGYDTITKLHGGTLNVDSIPYVITEFVITLPHYSERKNLPGTS